MSKFKILLKPLIISAIILLIVPNYFQSLVYSTKTTNNEGVASYGASLKDQLDDIQKKLEENKKKQEQYRASINSLQSDIGSKQKEIPVLENQVYLLNTEISGKELLLKELELKIEILTEEIEELKNEILDAIDQIEQLETETDGRLLNMYINQKQNISSSSNFFSYDGPSVFVKSDTYRQAMQQDTNNKLNLLEETRVSLENDKVQVEEDKIEVDKNRNQIEEEKIALDQKKVRVEEQKQLYLAKIRESGEQIGDLRKLEQFLTEEEKQLRAKYDSIQAAMLSKNEVANGLPIKKGTFLGIEGETGYAYGRHLHFGVSESGVIQNPCSYLPSGAYGDCGGSGTIGKPLSGAVLTSGFRTSSRPSHNAIDISTGGSGNVVATHDGYVYFFFEPCPSWAGVCNGGGAIVAKVCEVNGCASGLATVYYHLACTAEPSDSPRSCKQ